MIEHLDDGADSSMMSRFFQKHVLAQNATESGTAQVKLVLGSRATRAAARTRLAGKW